MYLLQSRTSLLQSNTYVHMCCNRYILYISRDLYRVREISNREED